MLGSHTVNTSSLTLRPPARPNKPHTCAQWEAGVLCDFGWAVTLSGPQGPLLWPFQQVLPAETSRVCEGWGIVTHGCFLEEEARLSRALAGWLGSAERGGSRASAARAEMRRPAAWFSLWHLRPCPLLRLCLASGSPAYQMEVSRAPNLPGPRGIGRGRACSMYVLKASLPRGGCQL